MLGGRSWNDWIAEYAEAHRNPINKLTHLVGIPLIAASIPLAALGLVVENAGWVALAMFVVGWILQFIGHAFEGRKPEFFRDWRFLLVGLRWWVAKVLGRA